MQYRVVAADAFSTQRQLLWDVCYRITGTVTDADVLVRDCFMQAMDRARFDTESEWRVHLLRCIATLATEALRQRKRRNYVGSWLPSPIETGGAVSPASRSEGSADGRRYDLVESGSMAFLRALELLEPRERVVFVMSDAFGIPIHDMASILELTAATTRTVLQAGRRKMVSYDATHVAPSATAQTEVAKRLNDCLARLQQRSTAGLEKTLAIDAQAIFDSGGEFVAPPGSVFGAPTVAKLLTKFADGTGPIRFSSRMLNGLPAALAQTNDRPRWANRFVVRIEVHEGLVSELQVIMATSKLTAIRFNPL